MMDLAVALGLVLVLEGVIWAFAPETGRKLLAAAAASDDASLRRGGMIAIALGCLIVWLIRG
jgi:uncharacterized protein YjeT (DUF2065 family)